MTGAGPTPADVTGAADATGLAAAPARRGVMGPLLRNSSGLAGLVLTGLVVLAGLLSLAGITPHDPDGQNPTLRLAPPSSEFLVGTDLFGRDVLSRVMAGAGSTLKVAVVAVVISAVVGTLAGLAAGYFGNAVRAPVLAVTNILFAFPPLLLALALAASFSRHWFTIAVAIAIVYIPIFVRVVRGPVLSLAETDFVRAATVAGMPTWRILLREILPSVIPVIIVQVSLSLSWAVLTEASLSFLGLGTPPPAASLGSMIYDARVLVTTAWWTMAGPGVAIVLLVIGLNLLGDGLRDVLDPRGTEA